MDNNIIPSIKDGTFTREEREGHLLLIANGSTQNDTIIVNETGKKILSLCNSKNNINDIVKKLSIEFEDNHLEKILDDVKSFLREMKLKNIIEFNMENVMFNGIDICNFEGYILHRCGEGELNRIVSLVNRSGKITNSPEKFVITTKTKKLDVMNNIRRLNIRNSLFKYLEEYYILSKKSNDKLEDVAIISFINSKNLCISIYEVGIFDYYEQLPENIIDIFVKKSLNNIKEDICPECKKIKFSTTNIFEKKSNILKTFKKNDFNIVGTLKDEYGEGVDKILLEKLFN